MELLQCLFGVENDPADTEVVVGLLREEVVGNVLFGKEAFQFGVVVEGFCEVVAVFMQQGAPNAFGILQIGKELDGLLIGNGEGAFQEGREEGHFFF